jgi:hypothetical protein
MLCHSHSVKDYSIEMRVFFILKNNILPFLLISKLLTKGFIKLSIFPI